MDYNASTVSQLRETAADRSYSVGTSKMRKAELVDLLEKLDRDRAASKRRAPKANKERRIREKGSRVGRRFGTKARSNKQDPRNVHYRPGKAA